MSELSELYNNCVEKVSKLRDEGRVIYPDEELYLSCMKDLALTDVNVVCIANDPYFNPGEAVGLAFSVRLSIKVPPILANIYKELISDVGIEVPTHGCLHSWRKQGVLLLNRVLTVEEGKPRSHAKIIGWEQFTEALIREINDQCENVVFMLWGRDAQSVIPLISSMKHLVLKAAHPSPMTAHSGFFGCKHFSKCNEYLRSKGKKEIDWRP